VSGPHSETTAELGEDLREVLLTLSPMEFASFARDLKQLREGGAASNTSAIVEAVRHRADMVRAVDKRRAA
jgi:hypothetical protein